MTARVKLFAIAKNEGSYIADWVFHHLHFGFDAIEIWINGTEDPSRRIINAISAVHPQISKRNADRLLASCISERRHFQLQAYKRQARRARRQRFTHVAFLDLDEYWTPRDFRSPIQSFLPDEAEVNVVSFPWCLDLPDFDRQPFERPLTHPVRVQVDRHVKSVGRLDGSLEKPHVHTFKTRSGERLLVRESFPLVDARAQKHGSIVTTDHWQQTWDRLPEAFVYHAINRSQQEYFANVAKGQRQSGRDLEFKTNRQGYLPNEAPVLVFCPPPSELRSYLRRRKAFHRKLKLDPMILRSQRLMLDRADALLRRIGTEPETRQHLTVALTGTTLAAAADSP